MKRLVSMLLAMMMVLSLCACTGSDGEDINYQDALGKVGKVIDDNKDQLVDGLEKIQEVAQDAIDSVE